MYGQSLVLVAILTTGALSAACSERVAAQANSPRKPPRVLLFASAPTRDFQFLVTLLLRDADKQRAEVSLYVQPLPDQKPRTGVTLGIPPERLLKGFPHKLTTDPANPSEKRTALSEYDVIIAIDPDWTQLSKEQAALLAQWVEKSAGGLILVAGPIHTYRLARPGDQKEKLEPIQRLCPVVLTDLRLEEAERQADKPHRLTFPPAEGDYPFLKLEAEGKESTAGWEAFFGDPKQEVRHGFFACYPVRSIKPDAVVLATFQDPAAKMADGKERPFLVVRATGKGRVAYIGSGEIWRLRQYRAAYHERLWLELIHYVGAVP